MLVVLNIKYFEHLIRLENIQLLENLQGWQAIFLSKQYETSEAYALLDNFNKSNRYTNVKFTSSSHVPFQVI